MLEKVISGAQSGADRAALDFAIAHGIPHGGWCPHGRKAEDGPIDPRYNLKETPSSGYLQRTEWNVRDSDGTGVFSIAPVLTGGSKKTIELALKHHKPVIHIARDGGPASPAQVLLRFVQDNKIKVLNVAGPRARKEPKRRGTICCGWWTNSLTTRSCPTTWPATSVSWGGWSRRNAGWRRHANWAIRRKSN